MATPSHCPACHAPLAGATLEGLCPRCLVEAFLAPPEPPPSQDAAEPATAVPATRPATEPLRYFGDYELVGEIARGGMGIVYRAVQRSLGRPVAVKLIRSGYLAHPAQIERFRREARAAASLQHPNIVAIHEVGEHRGQHYFSMDLVEGPNLAQRLAGRPQSADQAARWTRTLAEALQYAHSRGVIHRDLKPSNVLLDPQGRLHLADFGLAKFHEADLPAPAVAGSPVAPVVPTATSATQEGSILGSPDYMAPEQAAGRTESAGPACDIWALGALLYELLTGRPPFQAASAPETLRLVCEQDPVPPRRLNPGLPRDLETIALKCLAKSPAARYATAQELADDLGRFLRHEPIRARQVGPVERGRLWVRRHPARAVLALVSGLAVTVYAAQFASARGRLRAERYAADIHVAAAAIERGLVGTGAAVLDRLQREPRFPWERDLRGFEWHWLAGQLSDSLAFLPLVSPPRELRFSTDSRQLTARLTNGQSQGWQRASNALDFHWTPGAPGTTNRLDASPRTPAEIPGSGPARIPAHDAPLFATLGPGARKVVLWYTRPGSPRPQPFAECLAAHGRFTALAFSPDDTTLATGNTDGLVELWNASPGPQAPNALAAASANPAERDWRQRLVPQAGDRIATFRGHHQPVRTLAFAPDGESLASADDSQVRFWPGHAPVAGNFRPDLHPPIQFSADGRHLRTRTADGETVVLDAETLAPATTDAAPSFDRPTPAPDRFQCRWGAGRTVIVYETGNGRPRQTFAGHRADPSSAAVSPDGRTVASGDTEGSLRLWQRETGRELLEFDLRSPVRAIAFAPDGQRLVAADAAGLLWYWRIAPSEARGGAGRILDPATIPAPSP